MLDRPSFAADKRDVKQEFSLRNAGPPGVIPWALQVRAISQDEPSQILKSLTGAISGCGGWVLSRSATDAGLVDMLFEFERHLCLEVYSILIASGLELSQSAHLRFTELCQCTMLTGADCEEEIVSIDLEVQTYIMNGERTMAAVQLH
jgi:hypothetical protein